MVDKPGSVVDDHLSGICITAYLKQPTRTAYESYVSYLKILLGLAPDGVYPAIIVTYYAVRSYRTVSPLPEGGLFSVALSVDFHRPGVTWLSLIHI